MTTIGEIELFRSLIVIKGPSVTRVVDAGIFYARLVYLAQKISREQGSSHEKLSEIAVVLALTTLEYAASSASKATTAFTRGRCTGR